MRVGEPVGSTTDATFAFTNDTLAPLRGELVDALWTQFTPAGVDRLRRLVEKGLV